MTADIVLLTALEIEHRALVDAIPPQSRSEFTPGSIGAHEVALPSAARVRIPDPCGVGQLNASLATARAIATWHPSTILLVGFAATVDQSVELGDVVVSDQIVDYEIGKVSKGYTPRWSVYRTSKHLRTLAMRVSSEEWRSNLQSAPSQTTTPPKVHSGVVLSGNKVIANADAAGVLRDVWTQAKALEMEASGCAAAVAEVSEMGRAPDFLVIKGICDRADEMKNDLWQPYAAMVAACFTWHVLDRLQLPIGASSRQHLIPPRSKKGVTLHSTPAGGAEPDSVSALGSLVAPDRKALRLLLSYAYSLTELSVLVFDLGLDWELLSGTNKDEKVLNLIQYLERRSDVERLREEIRRQRPGVLETYVPNGLRPRPT